MSLPRYPEYKPSGVEWLGEVPEHWDVKPLKKSFAIVGGSTPKSETALFWDGDILWATPGDLSKRDSVYINDTQRKITAEGLASCGTTLVPAASIILSTRAPIGSLAIAETAMCTNQGCKSLVPSECADTEYFAHLLSISSAELNIRGKGTTFLEISGDELGAFRTPAPPLPEQTQIAAFLDRETAKIDELVAEQRRLMGLLKEKRQAVISHAVTQGLNPDAPMKSSGIEWLGDVPAHWDVVPLKHLCVLIKDGTHLPPERVDDGIPLLSVRNLVDGEFVFRDDDSMISEESFQDLCRAFVPQANDVLLAIVGATLGKTAIIPSGLGPFHIQRSVAIFRSQPDVLLAGFLNLVFQSRSFQDLLWEQVGYSAQPGIYLGTLQNIRIPVPSFGEQEQILDSISLAANELSTLTAEAQRAIDLLQERRTALISAAVTGQIDVRPLLPARKVGAGETATQEASKLVNFPHENHT